MQSSSNPAAFTDVQTEERMPLLDSTRGSHSQILEQHKIEDRGKHSNKYTF